MMAEYEVAAATYYLVKKKYDLRLLGSFRTARSSAFREQYIPMYLGSRKAKSAGTVDDPRARSCAEEIWHTPISLLLLATTPCTRRSAPLWKHLETKLASNSRSSAYITHKNVKHHNGKNQPIT